MANTSNFELVSLDHDTNKDALKAFMRNQSQFADYDFEGANLNVLLSLLSYNTFKNAFYLNMNMAESFLDSAQLRSSTISRAKELNYTPRSARSSQAIINVEFDTEPDVQFVTIPKGTGFSTVVGNKTFTFYTDDNIVLYPTSSSNSTVNHFLSGDISIYEGIYIQDNFIMDHSVDSTTFALSNKRVDTRSINILVTEDNGSTVIPYLQATTLLGLTSTSKRYFIELDTNEKYSIVFGDDVICRKPKDAAIITAEYRVASGEEPNGATRFSLDIDVTEGMLVGDVTVTTVQNARGGAEPETTSSIKYYAPRHFQIQERAIVNSDYEILLREEFPEINVVSVYGGDEVDPPQFGKVFVAVDLAGVEGFPEAKKLEYKNFLRNKMPMSIQVEMIEPDYVYYKVISTVRYNLNVTIINPDDIKTIVLAAILDYNEEELNDFSSTLRYSRFINMIDNAHESIVSNETDILIYKKFTPTRLGQSQNYLLDFHIPFHTDSASVFTATHQVIYSSEFQSNDQTVFIADDGNGIVQLRSTDGAIINPSIGTVDYSNGVVRLTNLLIDSFVGDGVKLYSVPAEKDITSAQSDILTTEAAEMELTIEAIRE